MAEDDQIGDRQAQAPQGGRGLHTSDNAVAIEIAGLAGLAEAAVVGILTGHNHSHPHEYPGTATHRVEIVLRHGRSMLRQFALDVNDGVLAVFSPGNIGFAIPHRAIAGRFPYAGT